ncbi:MULTISPECIES: LuxR C-terminal-related transcriptional regulator [Brevibacterium]|uniref:Regulatory protein, luxR family n=1 Tax=Brevibacterium antiquum CNRZ 918 TaxID=1255637 RepID=A0A2H1KZP9_9MICO|nr:MULTISPECIES: LuxR C-terminal-related transcriptional regulator [Brevibacterium]SMY05181.1 regulatory protein, luxR family [Brevibacterium antiquum CNRZ 918]
MIQIGKAVVFGRSREVEAMEHSLGSSSSGGILIEGEGGSGKTFLATLLHRRRGGAELWLRGDRILRSVDFGALGLFVDLDKDLGDLLYRVVSVLTGDRSTPVIFIDDAHDIDRRSLGVLSQLANDGDIRIVATLRRPPTGRGHPFDDLVADHVLDHIVLSPLDTDSYAEMVEHHLGGVVSRGVLDIVEFHSGRVPGKIVELLGYTHRARRFYDRQGVWVLDGRDIEYDERARDVTRIDLEEHPTQMRDALELVVLAGEIDVELMLTAGLGEAADALVAAGEILLENRGRRVYVAVENHKSETIRFTIPDGRSRQMYDFVLTSSTSPPSEWALMLRMDWALACGVKTEVQDQINAARVAARIGEWQRALRMLIEVPTAYMEAHELCDLGRLYCEVNQAALGFDVLAQAVLKARCADIIVEVFVVWAHRDFDRNSPTLTLDRLRDALDRVEALEEEGVAHGIERDSESLVEARCNGIDVFTARDVIDRLGTRPLLVSVADQDFFVQTLRDARLPDSLRVLLTVALAGRKVEQGANAEALDLLDHESGRSHSVGTGSMILSMARASALTSAGDTERAKRILKELPSKDIAYLTARSGPSDLVWHRVHTQDGALPEATRSAHAAVEGLEHWNQKSFLAMAIAEAAYVSIVGGNVEVAAEYEARFDELPTYGPYLQYRRAVILVLVAKALRTGEAVWVEKLRHLLAEAMSDGSSGLAALIRLMLFRHFDVVEPEEMCLLAGRGTGDLFRLLGQLGAALRDSDSAALLDIAASRERSLPDIATLCRSLASRFTDGVETGLGGGSDSNLKLTGRERQISSLIASGSTNSEIAAQLGVRVRTVEGHTYRLFQKLGITRREQVAGVLEELRAARSPVGPVSSGRST